VSAPLPPANLASRTPRIVAVTEGAILHRFYTKAFEPIFYDKSLEGRLNAPDGTYGVLYVADAPHGAFAETFLRQPGRQQLPADLLAKKAYVRLRASRDLRLIQFHGRALAPLGATAEVIHGPLPYDTPQAWSKGLHGLVTMADGIAYTARHDDSEVCYALFERAQDALVEVDRTGDLDVDWFWGLADDYEVGAPP
jgi:hypothetical protein